MFMSIEREVVSSEFLSNKNKMLLFAHLLYFYDYSVYQLPVIKKNEK